MKQKIFSINLEQFFFLSQNFVNYFNKLKKKIEKIKI